MKPVSVGFGNLSMGRRRMRKANAESTWLVCLAEHLVHRCVVYVFPSFQGRFATMDSLSSSASYTQMSSGAPSTGFTRGASSGVNAIQGGIDKVQSRCHNRAKLTYLTITSIVVM